MTPPKKESMLSYSSSVSRKVEMFASPFRWADKMGKGDDMNSATRLEHQINVLDHKVESIGAKIEQVESRLSTKIEQVEDKLTESIDTVNDRVNKAAICISRLDERTRTTNSFVIGIAIAVLAGICLQGIIWAVSR